MIYKWFKFYICLYISVFFFFDEEPFFDMTDLNIIHIFFLIVTLVSIVYENIIKSRYGQFLFKDQVLLFSTFSYFFFLQNYVIIVIFIFFFHSLVPLEIELFELVEIYSTLFSWLTYNIISNLIIMTVIFLLILFLNFYINWNNKKVTFIFSIFLFFFFILNLILILFDFLFSTLTNTLFWNNFKLFYFQSKTTLTYDSILYANDQYDWHRETTNFFIFRFEDLFIYSVELLTIFSFLCLLIILFFILYDFFNNLFNNKDISYISFSVLYTWLNNCLFIFLLNYIAILFVGLRVSFKILIENWDYFFFLY